MAGRQEIIDDKISYVTAQPLTARKVREEMHSGQDAAQRCFLRRSREAGERAIHSRQNFRGHAEFEMVRVDEGGQHLRRGRADDGMGPWVGGVRGGVADLGKPIGISLGFRVTVPSGRADRGNWSPEIVDVFSIVECDQGTMDQARPMTFQQGFATARC